MVSVAVYGTFRDVVIGLMVVVATRVIADLGFNDTDAPWFRTTQMISGIIETARSVDGAILVRELQVTVRGTTQVFMETFVIMPGIRNRLWIVP